MLPVLHPLVKTNTELRRSINRLRLFKEQNPADKYVANGDVNALINDLEAARSHIPTELIEESDGD